MTIAEKLQIVLEQKKAIKTALENQGKSPSDDFSTYAKIIDTLENPDQVTYCVTVDGENKTYAVLYGEERAELTATPNDIRLGTVAITNKGITEGEKDIPAYYSRYGVRKFTKGKEVKISTPEYDYKSLMASIATFNKSLSESTYINIASVGDAMYECKSNTKSSDITKDLVNEQINFGLTTEEDSVIRYFVVREE